MPRIEVKDLNGNQLSIDEMLNVARESINSAVEKTTELCAMMKATKDEFGGMLDEETNKHLDESAKELELAMFWALKAQTMLEAKEKKQ